MSAVAATRAANFYMRRATRSRFYVQQATPWSAGLSIEALDIVSSYGLAWQAQNGGITSGTAPNNTVGAAFTGTDGIKWIHLPLLLSSPALVG